MDSKSYNEALATINAADKDKLTRVVDTINDLKAAYEDKRAEIQAILDEYGMVDGPMIGARTTIQATVSQLNAMEFTFQNVAQTTGSALAAYTPAPTGNAPVAS